MTETELDSALEELDRLINDPDVRMDPDRVWALLAEVSAGPVAGGGAGEGTAPAPIAG